MAYREYPPHPSLARHVECYWSIRATLGGEDARSELVLPDGCMDIVLELGDRSGPGPVGAPTTVVGSMTRPLPVQYVGSVDLWGVRFRPGGATPFLDLDASELTDGSVSLDDVWGLEAEALREEVAGRPLAERSAAVDRALHERARRSRFGPDERVIHASERLAASRGALTIERLADEVGLGRRQLERRFARIVGLSPKTAARIARFRSVLARMHAEPDRSLSALALDGGYTDQAHMSREFRALADTTPGAYRRGLRARAGVAFVQDREAEGG